MESYGVLVARHEAGLQRFLAARTGSLQDAEDMTQKTFVRAFRALASYSTKRPFRPWLYTIARRLWIDAHRARRGEHEWPAAPEVNRQDPASLLIRRDEASALWRLAGSLMSEPQWTCLWLRHQEGMDVREIGAMTGYSAVRVRVLLHRARQRLAAGISEEERREFRAGLAAAARVPATPTGTVRSGEEREVP